MRATATIARAASLCRSAPPRRARSAAPCELCPPATLTVVCGSACVCVRVHGFCAHGTRSGDWMMGLSWCLCCGTISPLAYFYAAYFFVLLVHRSLRDDHFCAVKYGADWKEYKKRVPYLFVPRLI